MKFTKLELASHATLCEIINTGSRKEKDDAIEEYEQRKHEQVRAKIPRDWGNPQLINGYPSIL